MPEFNGNRLANIGDPIYDKDGVNLRSLNKKIAFNNSSYLPISGGTVTGNTNFSGNLSGATLFSGSTDLATIINNIASQYSGITGNFLSLSGGTVTGITYFTGGLSATTLSATTIYSGGTDLFDIILEWNNVLTTSAITSSTGYINPKIDYYGVNYNGNVNISIPSAVGIDGLNFSIKDEGGYAGTYRIRIIPDSGYIDGNNYVDMNINYMSLHLLARGSNWWII
jgi:hypothetical protein